MQYIADDNAIACVQRIGAQVGLFKADLFRYCYIGGQACLFLLRTAFEAFIIMLSRFYFLFVLIHTDKQALLRCPVQHIGHKTITTTQVVELTTAG